MKRAYRYHGHIIVVDKYSNGPAGKNVYTDPNTGWTYECVTCSIPYVIVQAVAFMIQHGIRKLAVEGVEITEYSVPE